MSCLALKRILFVLLCIFGANLFALSQEGNKEFSIGAMDVAPGEIESGYLPVS